MAPRIVSTVILWALVAACVLFWGPTGGVWLVAIVAVLTQREFYGLIRNLGVDPFDRFGMTIGAVLCLGPLYLAPHGIPVKAVLALAVIVFAIRILGERKAHERLDTLAWTAFGVIYIPFMLQFLSQVMLIATPMPKTGLLLSVWLIAVSKFCDVGALLSGMAFGRHKLAPEISPKKTWEGAVGGVLTSMGIGAGLVHWFGAAMPAAFTPWFAAALAVPVAILAIVSDLVESIVKRRTNAKDAGTTIPGIGGVFDLSDSLILTAPLGYVVFSLL